MICPKELSLLDTPPDESQRFIRNQGLVVVTHRPRLSLLRSHQPTLSCSISPSLYLKHRWVAQVLRLFVLRKASTVLKALRNNGLPEKDRGLTGPMVMKEYCRLFISNAECGSRKSW